MIRSKSIIVLLTLWFVVMISIAEHPTDHGFDFFIERGGESTWHTGTFAYNGKDDILVVNDEKIIHPSSVKITAAGYTFIFNKQQIYAKHVNQRDYWPITMPGEYRSFFSEEGILMTSYK